MESGLLATTNKTNDFTSLTVGGGVYIIKNIIKTRKVVERKVLKDG